MQTEHQLKEVLHLARKAIQELKQSLALEYLSGILRDVEDRPDTPFAAEYRLLYANALALSSKSAESAAAEFRGALQEIFDLPVPDIDLELRAHADFGNYQSRFTRRRSVAREQYQLGKRLAVKNNLLEHSAKFDLYIINI